MGTFKIVSDCDINYVQDKVNQLLSNGWKLHGSLVVTHSNLLYYTQAMVRGD